jgi:conjugative relaxase-like TrwC/TraI family protein
MLRITVNRSASGAKKYYSELYYSEGKSTQDYYSDKDQSMGTWGGKAAINLGLEGDIKKEDFGSLCDNLIPGSDQKLTPRNNSERRVGYDFTFNASKSVSLAYTFGSENDKKQLLQAFHESVTETMTEIETGVQARVRTKGQNENRDTGNIVYGEFTHFTSRPVDNVPDPHLHTHCFVFNSTYDNTEKKWKAGEFGQIKKDAPYYEAVFHATLANKLQSLGYSIDKTEKGFEIAGIKRDTIEKFSRRTEEIEQLAVEKNITNQKDKSRLGAKTRESKRKAIGEDEQLINWKKRLSPEEEKTLGNLKNNPQDGIKNKELYNNAQQAVDYSLKHHLERKSVATDKEILTTALRSTLGETTPQQIHKAFNSNKSLITVKENNQTFITTKEALREENNLIEKAQGSRGTFKTIHEGYQPKEENLTQEQRNAVQYALSTTDGITIIAGKAGTGKTTLMKEVQQGIHESGKQLFAFAPSAEASRVVQRKEGFENAQTLAVLIQCKSAQDKIKNAVIWIDEAGMISNKDMNKVLDIAKAQNARLILTGDTKQHSSVERGDALRILQSEGGIAPVQVNKIQRQKNEQYKLAVQDLSKSDVEKGFRKLDKIGVIHEIEDGKERIEKIADDYFSSTFKSNTGKNLPKEVLVVSPTHIEGEKVTQSIREKLKKENIISSEEKPILTFKNIQLTVAQKQKSENYTEGLWVIFHQNSKGFKAGSRYEITGTGNENTVLVKDRNGATALLPINKFNDYNLFSSKEIPLSKGDKIRITGNGKAQDGKHLFNGMLYQITGFDKQGNIKLSNGSTLPKDYGHLTSGYVMTSHASQGKTVDKVIISQSSMSLRASSKEQFYVSVSRGRQSVAIYTDDKADLLQAVSQSGERKSALELTRDKPSVKMAVEVNRIGTINKLKEKAVIAIQKIKKSFTNKPDVSNELSGKNKTTSSGKNR